MCVLLAMMRTTCARDISCRAEYVSWFQVPLVTNGTCPPDFFLSRLADFFSLAVRVDCFLDSLLLRWIFDMIVTPGPNWACTATMKVADKQLEHALTRGLDALAL
jgi:hypothetical protein